MRYEIVFRTTDPEPGWNLGGNRFVPRRYTISVQKYFRVTDEGATWVELSHAEVVALHKGAPTDGHDARGGYWAVAPADWLELDCESTSTMAPRCVALRAPGGISTPEQRFPIAGLVAEATARLSRKDGETFFNIPQGIELEDARAEARRIQGRRRPRSAITDERLDEVLDIVGRYPRTPTAAVQRHFKISRGYARKLIKLAEGREPNTDEGTPTDG